MQFRISLFLIIFLSGTGIWLASCNQTHPNHAAPVQYTGAEALLVEKIHTAVKLKRDDLMAPQLRALYEESSIERKNDIYPQIINALNPVLLFHTDADPQLISFFRQRYADSILNDRNRANTGIRLANYYAHILRNADSAQFYLRYAKTHPDALNDSLFAKVYGIDAQILQLKGSLQEAAASLYQELTLDEQLKDTRAATGVYLNLANVYRNMGDHRKAIELRKKGLNYFKELNDETSAATALGGIGADYLDLKEIDSARPYLLEAETIFKKGARSPVAAYYLYLSKAGMYVTLKRFDSSVQYFDKARKILALFNDPAQERLFTITSAIAYVHVRDVNKEIALIKGYIPQMLADSDLQGAADAYYSLYVIASNKRSNANEALDYYQQYDSLKTSLSDNRNRDFVAEQASKYESQEKTLKIERQQKALKQKTTENMVLLLLLIAATFLAGMVIVRLQLLRSRRAKKSQQLFTSELLKNTEEERGRIAGELHDGISHELLTLKNSLGQDEATTGPRIDHIINEVRRLSRNLHPVMLDKIGLKYSAEHLAEQLMASSQLFVSTAIEYDHQLSPDQELQLYRILQESLTNVIKHANAHAAKITIRPENKVLLVTIQDNGAGFNSQEMLESTAAFGLHSIIERGKALGGKTTITANAQGTIIHLQIPLRNGHYSYR